MEYNDKRIAHLKNLGRTQTIAIANLEEELKINPDFYPDFLEIAEITDSNTYRDGVLLNKTVNYVAGICGSRKAKSRCDFQENIYSLVYFNKIVQRDNTWKHTGATIHSNDLRHIVDYRLLK